jgi:Response regulator containing a CheY-like receiver domain and an HTH DNA-binding domain
MNDATGNAEEASGEMRILVVEDVRETREWVVRLVRQALSPVAPRLSVTETATMRQALGAIGPKADNPGFDLAFIDLSLPDGDGFRVLRYLKSQSPATVGVVTTAMAADSDIVAALAAGAQGYLLKDQPEELIVRQIAAIQAGVPAISPPIARRIMEHFRLTGPNTEPESLLTEREQEVLSLIGRGQRVPEVAQILGVAHSTIATHIKSIYAKLGISSRAEAAVHASRMGLT